MHVTLVHVTVKPEHIDDFIVATHQNHEASVRETGNRRFDVFQSSDNPEQFVLYEACSSMRHTGCCLHHSQHRCT